MSRPAGGLRWVLAPALVLATLDGGCKGLRFGAGAPPGSEAAAARDTLAQRALDIPTCNGTDLSDRATLYVFELATGATVRGEGLSKPQTERVVRQGVAALCADGAQTAAVLLTCNLVRTPVEDTSGDCAALQPSVALLANLPTATLVGGTDVNDPNGVGSPDAPLTLLGFDERWGLAADADDLPTRAPDSPEAAADLPGLEDLDADKHPGVTLTGDGDVPTVVWAARQTRASLRLGADGRGNLGGRVRAVTSEVVLGGPASRAVGERTFEGADDVAVFVRADGLSGSPRADANRDGQVTCIEAAALFNRLPAPPGASCR